jgi:diguanylate cyclase (GGDEF)-like protein
VYVVATSPDEVSLPPDEFRFYLIILSLAVVLLLLAGVTLVVEQRSLLERASFDALTKLPNRSEFERRAADVLVTAERAENGVCLLLFDLNGFKQINDTHGHLVGDEVLKVIGARLRKAVRDHDVVARWGGDEFVVVMPGIATPEMGSRRALQLAEQVGGRTRLDGIDDPLRVKVSVGVAIWPDHGDELADLVIAADQAMYEAKREGVTCRVATALPPKPELVHTHA